SDAGGKARPRLDMAAFIGAAGDAAAASAGSLRELAGDRPYGARGGRHQDGLATLRSPDLAQADIGREPRHAEYAERRRQRRLARIEFQQSLGWHRAEELPAVTAISVIALAEAGIPRANDLADDPTLDHGTDIDRLRIGARRTDPTTHVGI